MFSIECINDRWHVCRGDIIVSPGYRFKEMAERELSYRVVEEYRILISVEGAYHPQWRWNSAWGWNHFKQKTNNAYVVCKSLSEAERFMAEQDITRYDTVQEQRDAHLAYPRLCWGCLGAIESEKGDTVHLTYGGYCVLCDEKQAGELPGLRDALQKDHTRMNSVRERDNLLHEAHAESGLEAQEE